MEERERSYSFICPGHHTIHNNIIIRINPLTETEERECLLLDEYAGCPAEEIDQATSCSSGTKEIPITEIEDAVSDVEVSEPELSSGDDSTDIDAVVKEYRDRIQVSLYFSY
jgi:hypothetical protein